MTRAKVFGGMESEISIGDFGCPAGARRSREGRVFSPRKARNIGFGVRLVFEGYEALKDLSV